MPAASPAGCLQECDALAPCRLVEAGIEGGERDIGCTRGSKIHCGRQLYGVVTAQPMSFGEHTGSPDQSIGHLHDAVLTPLLVQLANDTSQHACAESFCARVLRKGRAGFRICSTDGDQCRRSLDRRCNSVGSDLGDVQLHQRARVEIQDHPRPSMTMSDTSRLRLRDATRGLPLGLPTPRCRTPRAAKRSSTSSSAVRATGTRRATGRRRRSPMVMVRPCATARRYALSRVRSSRTPTIVWACFM